ncbi:MAG: helix-turn-helix domain-containing protein, partial [Ruminococcus sp.]|nr:helix-turn-helix domain-containing protein [Ruminococcus sp.]
NFQCMKGKYYMNDEYNYIDVDEEEWKNNFSKTLNNLIFANNTNYSQLAVAIGVDIKTVNNYIKGKSIPTAVTLMKIARYFDVSVDFLVTGIQPDCKYSVNTLRELINLIANFDIKLNHADNIGKNYKSVSITIKDSVLAPVITELCMTHKKDFLKHAEKIVSLFGNMKVFEQNLVDYQTFCNLIEDRFLYDRLEKDIEQYGMIMEIYDEIERRKKKWKKMSLSEREEWWRKWLKRHKRIN